MNNTSGVPDLCKKKKHPFLVNTYIAEWFMLFSVAQPADGTELFAFLCIPAPFTCRTWQNHTLLLTSAAARGRADNQRQPLGSSKPKHQIYPLRRPFLPPFSPQGSVGTVCVCVYGGGEPPSPCVPGAGRRSLSAALSFSRSPLSPAAAAGPDSKQHRCRAPFAREAASPGPKPCPKPGPGPGVGPGSATLGSRCGGAAAALR